MPEPLAELLYRFRSGAKLSQEALAERAGLSARTVSDIETGYAKTPRLVTIVLLAEALGLGDADRLGLQEAGRKGPARHATHDGSPAALPLPQPRTLVGRDADVATAGELLGRTRLLTLCGPAGVGKTSVALSVAWDRRGSYPAGVSFVELAPILDPALAPSAIANVLGVQDVGRAGTREAVVARLRDRSPLLVLDNLEHLTPLANWLSDLLEACPALTILATSREPLHVKAETVFAIRPLDAAAAVELFVSRAQAVKPDFAATPANRGAIAAIVQRLDGLPLAIELAAPRLRLLPPNALAARLDRRLPLLDQGAVDLPERLQTMRAAIAWSYDLLSPQEQGLFRALSVLSGGGSLEAAREIVAADPPDARVFLLWIAALVEKNLLSLEEDPTGEPRLTMLEMLREFAFDQLGDAERAEVRARHAAYFLRFAEFAEPALRGSDQALWLRRLERERPNLLAALSWYAESANPQGGLRLAAAVARFWWLRGYLGEGQAWLERFANSDPGGSQISPHLRARGLRGLVTLLSALGNFDEALGPCEEAVRLQREIRDESGLGDSLTSLGIVMQFRGELARARAMHEESLAIRRRIDDDLGIAKSLSNLASIAISQDDMVEAARLAHESMTIYRRLGDTSGMSHALTKLGLVAIALRDYEGAERLFQEALALQRELGNTGSMFYSLINLANVAFKRGQFALSLSRHRSAFEMFDAVPNRAAMAGALEGLAGALTASGDARRAARILGAADALRRAIGSPLFPAERADYEEAVGATRRAIGDSTFETEWQLGSVMTLERTLEEARVAQSPSTR